MLTALGLAPHHHLAASAVAAAAEGDARVRSVREDAPYPLPEAAGGGTTRVERRQMLVARIAVEGAGGRRAGARRQ